MIRLVLILLARMAAEARPGMGDRRRIKPRVSRCARGQAVAVLDAVLGQGRSLATALSPQLERLHDPREQAFMQELCYGVLRWLPRLEALAELLLHKPLRARDQDIHYLIMLGLYQLIYMRVPAHAAVDETVTAARNLGKDWAGAVINAVLRNYQRRCEELERRLEDNCVAVYAHPGWLIDRIRADWPHDWRALLDANQQRPPMTLRVNVGRQSCAEYRQQCQAAGLQTAPVRFAENALVLDKAVEVTRLPGFADGCVSVQDAGAQQAPALLDLQPGQRVLDACAAPGGKTGHTLETRPDIDLLALDIDDKRLQRVDDNLKRLRLKATLLRGDAAQPESWWDGEPFDRILLDAPCSATGVIRRHPDIKYLRQDADIDVLTATQASILTALWPLLKPGGRLLYVSCSILVQENHQQIENFLERHPDALPLEIDVPWGRAMPVGWQIMTGSETMDGFYYACIVKES